MSKLVSISALACLLLLAGALGLHSTILQTSAQTSRSSAQLRIGELEVKSTVTLPCPPSLKALGFPPLDDGKVHVSAWATTDIPVNYHYSVTGGRILGNGQNVIWDLNGSDPGEYSITVRIDDGMGNRSEPVTRRVTLAGALCRATCVCPALNIWTRTSEVRDDETLTFEVLVSSRDPVQPKFYWTVENGTIRSGQGTDTLEVVANGDVGSLVTATVQVVAFPDCNCSGTVSESVPISTKTVVQDVRAGIVSVGTYETFLFIDCPKGVAAVSGSPYSESMIVPVITSARSNSIRDRLKYVYSVTGGTIVGSGPLVSWDLTGYGAGLYEISVAVDDGRVLSEAKKQTVTVRERECGGRIECPSVSPLSVKRIGQSDDYIVRTSVAGAIPELVWTVNGGTIIAGQGTRSIRVRSRWNANDPTPTAKVSLILPDTFRDFCEPRLPVSIFLSK